MEKKIYICAFDRQEGLEKEALKLLDKLCNCGFNIYWNKQYRDLETTEREIIESDAFLAIADLLWVGSSRMMGEMYIANTKARNLANQTTNLPVFIYPVDNEALEKGLMKLHLKTAILLDKDVDKAFLRISMEMSTGI